MIRTVTYFIVFALGLGTSFHNPKYVLVDNALLTRHLKMYADYCTSDDYGLNQTDVTDFCTAYAALENFRLENRYAK